MVTHLDPLDRLDEEPPDGLLEQERLVGADRDPVPLDERRDAAREVLGEVRLIGARIDTPQRPASSSTSKIEAARPIEIETSGGVSETDTSDETVSPALRPADSATTTDTPAGHRRKSARCSSRPLHRNVATA